MVVQDCRKWPVTFGLEKFSRKSNFLILEVDNFGLSETLGCVCSASTQ